MSGVSNPDATIRQVGAQQQGVVNWQIVTSRIARLGDQYLLQLPADQKAQTEFYGDHQGKSSQRWHPSGTDPSTDVVPPLPTTDQVQESVQRCIAKLTAHESLLEATADGQVPSSSKHREKRARLHLGEQPAASSSELVRFLEASSPESWIGTVAFQVASWAQALRTAPAAVLLDAMASEEDYTRRAQMGVFATGEAPLVAPNPLLPILVRCGTEHGYKSDVFALFLACLLHPDNMDAEQSGLDSEMTSRMDAFCKRLARQVAETVFGLFYSALRHMATGVPLNEESLLVSTASNARATATTTSFRNLPPVIQARRALRFLAALANVHIIDSEWFVRDILHDLLTEAALFGAEHDQAPLSRSQAFIELALDGLLPCGREAERVAADQVDAIFRAAERFVGTSRSPPSVIRDCACMERLFSPVKMEDGIASRAPDSSSVSVHVSRRLHELFASCRELRARAWHSTLLPQYYLLFWGSTICESSLRLRLHPASVPRHSVDARYPVPAMRLHITQVELFPTTQAPADTGQDSGSVEHESVDLAHCPTAVTIPFTERFLAVERLTDILDAFLANRHLCVRMLRRLTPGFTSSDHQVVLVETVLNGMLELPRPRSPLLFYAAVLVELCRGGDPQTAIYLLQAVETLIREARRLDTEVMDRVAEWLAFHLSHFRWKWNWDAWIPLLSDVHSAALITTMLEYAVRLSYRERIQEVIPAEFHQLLVPRPEPRWDLEGTFLNDNVGRLLLSIPESVEMGLAKRLAESTYDVVPYLNEHVPKELRPAAYLRSMLRGGHEAPSFFATMIDHWGAVLGQLRDEHGAAASATLASIVLQVWRQSHQQALLALNSLCGAEILDRATVVASAFRQLLARYSSPEKMTYADISDLRFPFEVTRVFQAQFIARLRWTQRDVQTLLLAVSRAAERDVEKYQLQLTQAQQMLQRYRQGLKRLLVTVLDCLAQLFRQFHSDSNVAFAAQDTTEAHALQQWLTDCAQGLVQELLRTHLDQTSRLLGTLKALLLDVNHQSLHQMLEDLDQLALWSLAIF
jgi:hypothetical protein